MGLHHLWKLTLVWFSPPSGLRRSKFSWSQAIPIFLERFSFQITESSVSQITTFRKSPHFNLPSREEKGKGLLVFPWQAQRQENKTWFLNQLPHLLILFRFCGLDLECNHNQSHDFHGKSIPSYKHFSFRELWEPNIFIGYILFITAFFLLLFKERKNCREQW